MKLEDISRDGDVVQSKNVDSTHLRMRPKVRDGLTL